MSMMRGLMIAANISVALPSHADVEETVQNVDQQRLIYIQGFGEG